MTMKDDDAILAALHAELGLDDAHLEAVEGVRAPQRGLGLKATPAVDDDLRARVEARFDVDPVVFPGLPDLGLHAWTEEAGVFTVEPGGCAVVPLGEIQPLDADLLLVDARRREAGLLVEGRTGRHVIAIAGQSVRLYRVHQDTPPPAPPVVPAPPPLVPPELATLLGDDALDDELEVEVRDRLAAGEPYEVVAAVGMTVRHKRPAARSLETILAAKDAPTALERARAWWTDRTAHHVAVLATALDEVDRLRDGLQAVRDAVAHEDRAKEIAQAWLRSRDDLAGVATILGSDPLNEAIRGLDDALRAASDPFLDIDGLDTDRRLSIATWTDPSAIWTRLIRD